jgi:hypothetical protein
MTLAGPYINQQHYIKHYRGSMLNVALDRAVDFPTLAKFKDQPDSPELRQALQNTFGFSDFNKPDWLCNTRARIDIEDFARQPDKTVSLWKRLADALDFGVDP